MNQETERKNISRLMARLVRPLSPDQKRSVVNDLDTSASPGFDFFLLVFLSCAIATLGLITNSAAVIIGASRFVETVLEVDYTYALIGFTALTAVYVVFGGLIAVMYTDAFQGALMIIGMSAILIITFWLLGGVVEANQALPGQGDPTKWASKTVRRPLYPYQPLITTIATTASVARSNYNALQVKFEYRMPGNLMFLNAFTWSQAKDNGAGSLENPNGNVPGPQDFYNQDSFEHIGSGPQA